MTHSFAGKRARVLHPGREVRERVEKRLISLGFEAEGRWPALESGDEAVDVLAFDIDRGEDGQFPWPAGAAPMPTIGLIGSETPGRLQWAIAQKVDAYLPIGATANLFSALVIAFARHAERAGQDRNEAEIIRRNGLRLDLIRAVNSIARTEAVSDTTALKRLRAYAMVERLALEDAAVLYLSQTKGRRGRA